MHGWCLQCSNDSFLLPRRVVNTSFYSDWPGKIKRFTTNKPNTTKRWILFILLLLENRTEHFFNSICFHQANEWHFITETNKFILFYFPAKVLSQRSVSFMCYSFAWFISVSNSLHELLFAANSKFPLGKPNNPGTASAGAASTTNTEIASRERIVSKRSTSICTEIDTIFEK